MYFLGAKNYVKPTMLFIYCVAYLAFFFLPVAMGIASFARPCAPPSFTMGIILPCKSWDDVAGASYKLRIFVGLIEWRFIWVITSVVILVLETIMVYPSEISAVWVDVIFR